MSTMREQFEAWFKPAADACKAYDSDYSWKVWQAATEAATAAGTAVELPPVPRAFTGQFEYAVPGKSMTRIESGYTADQMREYGQACAAFSRGIGHAGGLKAAEASRQPAPVVAVKPEDITLESWDRHPRGGMQVGMPLGVKLTHKPTATVICVDSNRSQHRNKALAMDGLRAILAATRASSSAKESDQ